MQKIWFFLSLQILISLIITIAYAKEPIDEHAQKALRQTMELLTNEQLRNQSINSLGQPAKKADSVVEKLTGDSETKEEIYELSALIMRRIVHEANGDVSKLEMLLQQAADDPETFAKKFTPEERKKLKDIAKKIKSKGNGLPKN